MLQHNHGQAFQMDLHRSSPGGLTMIIPLTCAAPSTSLFCSPILGIRLAVASACGPMSEVVSFAEAHPCVAGSARDIR